MLLLLFLFSRFEQKYGKPSSDNGNLLNFCTKNACHVLKVGICFI